MDVTNVPKDIEIKSIEETKLMSKHPNSKIEQNQHNIQNTSCNIIQKSKHIKKNDRVKDHIIQNTTQLFKKHEKET
jgi:hypothetical protein